MNDELMQKVYDSLSNGEIELSESLFDGLSYDEKLEVVTDALCNEWWTNDHWKYIKTLVNVFVKSVIKDIKNN